MMYGTARLSLSCAMASMACSRTHQSVSFIAARTSVPMVRGSFRRTSPPTAKRRITSDGSLRYSTRCRASVPPAISTSASMTRSRTHQSSSRRNPRSCGASSPVRSPTFLISSVAMRRTFVSRERRSQTMVCAESIFPAEASWEMTSVAFVRTAMFRCVSASTRCVTTFSSARPAKASSTRSRMAFGPATKRCPRYSTARSDL